MKSLERRVCNHSREASVDTAVIKLHVLAAGALLKTNAQVYKITASLGCFLHLGTRLSFLWYELWHLVQLTCCTSSRWFNKNKQPANNANSVSVLKHFTYTGSVFKANDWFEVNDENTGSLRHRNPRAFVSARVIKGGYCNQCQHWTQTTVEFREFSSKRVLWMQFFRSVRTMLPAVKAAARGCLDATVRPPRMLQPHCDPNHVCLLLCSPAHFTRTWLQRECLGILPNPSHLALAVAPKCVLSRGAE